jgi:hypothetical protein
MPVTPFALVFVSLRRLPPFRVLISIGFQIDLAVGPPQWSPRWRPLFTGPETDRSPCTNLRNLALSSRLVDAALPLCFCSWAADLVRAL